MEDIVWQEKSQLWRRLWWSRPCSVDKRKASKSIVHCVQGGLRRNFGQCMHSSIGNEKHTTIRLFGFVAWKEMHICFRNLVGPSIGKEGRSKNQTHLLGTVFTTWNKPTDNCWRFKPSLGFIKHGPANDDLWVSISHLLIWWYRLQAFSPSIVRCS